MTRYMGSLLSRWREEVLEVAAFQPLDSDQDLLRRGVQSVQLLKDQLVPSEAVLLGLVL